jgi:GNAT superfamily N-acetyltransferase
VRVEIVGGRHVHSSVAAWATAATAVVIAGGPRPLSVTLRPADEGDRAFLFEAYASFRRDALVPLGWDELATERYLRTQFEAEERDWRQHRPGAQCMVILSDDEPVGRFYLARSAQEIRVMDITLLPEHQGQGIGTALLGGLLEEARRSHRTVRAHVERGSAALRLYRRLGFLHAATRGGTWLMEWTAEAAS